MLAFLISIVTLAIVLKRSRPLAAALGWKADIRAQFFPALLAFIADGVGKGVAAGTSQKRQG